MVASIYSPTSFLKPTLVIYRWRPGARHHANLCTSLLVKLRAVISICRTFVFVVVTSSVSKHRRQRSLKYRIVYQYCSQLARNYQSVLSRARTGLYICIILSTSVVNELSKMSRLYLALIVLISCANIIDVSAVVVPFDDCGSKSVKVTKLDFDCAKGEAVPCLFVKGDTYHGNISFTAKAEIPKGKIFLHAIIDNVSLPFKVDKPDICSEHNLKCPIHSGANEVLTIQLTVPSFAPDTNLVAKFEIKATKEATDDIMCVEVLAQIISEGNQITV